jgi:hypothetical protein
LSSDPYEIEAAGRKRQLCCFRFTAPLTIDQAEIA